MNQSIKYMMTALAVGICALVFAGRSDAQMLNKNVGELKFAKILGEPPVMKDKIILLEFWATWCPPCRRSIPHLNQLHAEFKDKGLVIIGCSNEAEATVTNFRKSMPMNYTVALDKSLGGKFGVTGIPRAFLINHKGVVIWEGHPMQLTSQTIQKALATLPPPTPQAQTTP